MKWKTGKYTNGHVRHITWRKGKPWIGTLSCTDEAGETQTITKEFDASVRGEAAAEKALREWRDEMEEAAKTAPGGLDPISNAEGITVAEYVHHYIDNAGARGELERSTVKDYSNSLKRFAKGNAPIADTLLMDLKRADVQRWIDGLTPLYSATVVRKTFRLLREVMGDALALDDIPKNPTDKIKLPKQEAKPSNALDAAGRARVIQALEPMEATAFKTAVALALYAGMREEEICGLRWRNVDLNTRTLWVREAIGYDGKTYAKEPKTGGSMREIPLFSGLVEILEARRSCMMRQCADEGVLFKKDMYVIGYVDSVNHYCNPNTISREWTHFARSYNLIGITGERVKFHDLRHTFATSAIVTANKDVKTVGSLMGHTNTAVTLNMYTAADPEAKRAAIEDIGKAIEQEAPEKVLEFKTGTAGE